MEECESLDSEMTELQSEASEAISQDDEDEVEELQNSLREVVQDQSVKPKLQCLMVDPSFSMVTVQSEDSGIVWETASSRCSTPWASETSSTSEAYSMEGSGAAGKITIVFDEEKVVRRRTRSGGRSSRLGDRLSRPGSSRSASALGVERPEMAEVSLPNVKQEKTETEPDLEEIKSKDQQLFSLISEGYEILNIRVPSKLPTVDEEESTELQDNLSYLDQTPKIRSRNHQDWTRQQNHFLPEEGEILDHQEPSKQDSSEPSADTESGDTTQKEGTSDIDYFEKFTLLDEVVPGEQAPEVQEEAEQPAVKPQAEEQKSAKETATDSPSASEDSFVFVTDVEIVGEHLDEVFYGEGAPADALQRRDDDEAEGGARMRSRRESQRSMKESGSVLFGSEETTLTPIYISPGPPKIIDPILLEEPTAMSFMYSDLYEDAMGEWRRSDEECSEAESVASEKSYKRCLSDSEEADGYLEKFILKDETPTVDVQPESVEDKREGRMMWSQSKFEMTGCLTRVVREEDVETKTEEPKAQEDQQSATFEDKRETVTETEKEREETQLSVVTDKQAVREESVQEKKRTDDQMEGQEVKHEVKRDQTEPPESSTDEPPTEIEEVDRKDVEKTERESEAHQSGEHERSEQSIIETEQPCQTQEVAEKEAEEVVKAAEEMEVKAPISSDVPHTDIQSEIQRETTEKSLSEEAATGTKMAVADEEVAAESEKQEMLTPTEPSGEIETSSEMPLCEGKDAAEVVPEDVAPVEVITDCDCDCAVQAVVEVTEKVVNEKQIQTQVQIDLQEVTSAETTDAPEGAKEHEALAGGTAAESQLPESVPDVVQQSEVKTETSSEVIEPEMPEDIKADSDKKHHEILGHLQSVTDSESDKTKLTTEPKATTPTADVGPAVQEMVNVGDELILLVPKGQAIEMDIDVGQWSDKTTGGAELLPEPDSTCERLITPDDTPATMEETKTDPQLEVEPDVAVKIEEPSIKVLERGHAPPAPVEDTEGKKTDVDLKGDDGVFSPLRSFTPQEHLCELHREDIILEDAEKAEMHKVEDAPEAIIQDTTAPVEEIKTEPQLEVEADVAVEVEELSRKDLDIEHSTPAPVEEADTEGKKTEENLEGDDGFFSPLRSFTPREDLSELHKEDLLLEEAENLEIHKVEDAAGAIIEDTPAPVEEIKTEPQLEIETDVAEEVEELSRKDLVRERSLPAPVDDTEEKKTEENLEGDEGVFSLPRSFTPREDLSELRREDILSEEAEKVEIHKMEDAVEAVIIKGGVGPDIDLHREDIGQKMEQDEVVAEAPEVPIEEFEYEVISKQDAEEMPEPEKQRDAEESRPGSGQGGEERVEVGLETEMEMEMEEKGLDLSPEEELIEADYEIIDAEEESQARLAAELQGMDWFCLTCGCLLSEDDRVSGEHQSHEATAVDKAYEEIKEKLSDWISELQGRSENIEDLVSELELAYNSVEDQCVESEAAMQAQNEEMMALVMEQYNNMSVSMEEEKKAKLEQLYDQIVSFQEGIDSAKATLETTAREAETDARSPEDIHARLKAALDSAMSVELGPKGLLVFEDYAKGNASSSHLAQRKGIPVPQKPTLQPQEPGSATSTSVTVYWKVNPGDIIDCFQVYCMEDPQGAVSEEYRVTVKESYCVLEELEPDRTYKVWVMAVNYTGCSLPSERLAFTTAPSVPVIDTERCTVMWDSAALRWQQQSTGQSYTLEYCRQYELEGEGLRSISGIKSCEQRVLLQPNENYLFYIKAVNEAGASEQSEAALISTKGTRFHLLKASAHPALELSVDQTTLHYPQDTYENTPLTDKQCPSILGELLPARGHYYWETVVSGSPAYRLGVAYSTAGRDGSLGEDSQSWCLQCVPTPSGCRYQLLHNDAQSSVFVIEMPERVGALLDYQLGRLSFYNARSGQLLGTFSQRFAQPCHPALALEMPGSLEVCMVPEVPEFTKDS